MLLLEKTAEMLTQAGWHVVNIDVTLIAQRPKIAPYIEKIRQNIAEKLQISVQQVNVKGTTEEKLGFTGDGSGIACHAICLIEKTE